MPVKLQPTSVIITQLGLGPGGAVKTFFANECVKRMDKYIPMDEGNLRTIKDVSSDFVIYESPYARYQYYGMREDGSHIVKNYTTPGTGTYWDRRMWSAEGKEVVDEIQKYIIRRK